MVHVISSFALTFDIEGEGYSLSFEFTFMCNRTSPRPFYILYFQILPVFKCNTEAIYLEKTSSFDEPQSLAQFDKVLISL